MNFESIQKIEAEIFCKEGVNPDKANPVIKLFREQLEALRLQDHHDHLKGRIIELDDFSWNHVQPNLLTCNWQARWNVVDMGNGSAIDRFNNQSKALISKLVHTIEVRENGVTIRVLDVNYR